MQFKVDRYYLQWNKKSTIKEEIPNTKHREKNLFIAIEYKSGKFSHHANIALNPKIKD